MARTNTDQGPITRRKSYWGGAVGSDVDLSWTSAPDDPYLPREIKVFKGGNLAVTYWDGSSETITGITDGTTFKDCCWAKITASGSTAYNISVGW